MNTLDEQKLNEFLDKLKLSPTNKAMALSYLLEGMDDEFLDQAEPENFLHLTTRQRVEATAYLGVPRQKGDRDMMARFYKLFWAMGKATANFVMTDLTLDYRNEPRSWRTEVLGTVPVAAMEAFAFTWQSFHLASNPWLHELAEKQPEVLEQAQSLCGAADDRMSMTIAGLLLSGSHDDAVLCRQRKLLCNANLSYFQDACQCLTDQDRQNLADYIRQGDPTAPVPDFAPVNAQANTYLTVPNDAQIIGLAGTASFLAAGRDPQASCALRVYARMNHATVLARLMRVVPQDVLLRDLDHLTDALPDGQVQLLLYIARYPMEDDLKKAIAAKCQNVLDAAMKAAEADQYVMLEKMYPRHIATVSPDLENRIIRAICDKFQARRQQMEDFLTDLRDLSGVPEQMKQFNVRSYTYLGPAIQLLNKYRQENGWNDFVCRCTVVIGLLLEGTGFWVLLAGDDGHFEQGLTQMSEAMLERKLPVKELLNIYSVIPTYVNNEVQQTVENVVRKLLPRPENLGGLAIAAKEGSVSARQMAISALNALSKQTADTDEIREVLLACTADSSKQVRELLQSVLTAHPEWSDAYIPMLKSKKAAERLLAVGILANMGEQMRPVLEEALAAEKSSKVADAIQNILGQASLPQAAGDDLVGRVLKGNKIRKVQWLLDQPLPELHRAEDGTAVSEDHRAAILVAYSELGRIGRSDTAAELAKDIEEADLATLAHEVFERWMSAGAQAKTKWVLPFAAVFGGASMTAKLVRAINDWPQHARGAIACDAVTALALSTDPAALLAVDAISRKFKFRQVKTAAAAALENAARELGITAEELADRIVPDLGFDSDGRRVFDYGQRSFTVRLTPTLEMEICNHLGKKVKNLPAPGKTDDEIKAAEAYEAFKTMKKQIRTTVSTQKARLEAALSSLRCWRSDAWEALFVRNPIMHQFAISLIWGVYEDGKLTETFRYMEDGSFNTVDEDEYELPEGVSIGLVHPIELDEETLDGWKQQLEDYEIIQSIQQLERPVYALEENGRSLERFGGKMLNGLSLAGKLLGLGWYRGSVQDGGMYGTFYREDPALGYAVELRFSGSFVGDENDTVTVYDAVFYKPGTVKRGSYVYDEPQEADIFDLSSIPARYYSEIIYQLERATASSTECNENWKAER